MTERISSNDRLQQQVNDFMDRTLTDEEFNAVKDAEKEGGKISLDDDGKLVVLRPDARRDNWFVRFFKGLFKGDEYKTEQRLLDKVPQLAANKTFSKALQKSFAKYVTHNAAATNNYGHMQGEFNYKRVVRGMLDIYAQSGKEITAGDLRQALKNSELMTGSRIVQAKSLSSDDKQTYCANVYFHGKMMTARDFSVKQIMEAEHERETLAAQNQESPAPIKTDAELKQWAEKQISDEESIVTAFNNHFMKDPGSLKDFLPQKDIDRMSAILGDKNGLNGSTGKEYATLLAKAAISFYHKVGEYANNRLMQGDAPQQVADGIKDIFNIGGSSKHSQSFASQIRQHLEVKAPVISENLEIAEREHRVLDAQKAASLRPDSEAAEKIRDIKQYAQTLDFGRSFNIDDRTAAQISDYCVKTGQDPHYFLHCAAQFAPAIWELSLAEPQEISDKVLDLLGTMHEKIVNAKRSVHADVLGDEPEIGMADNVGALLNTLMFFCFAGFSHILTRDRGLFSNLGQFENSYRLFSKLAMQQGISSEYQQSCSNAAAEAQFLTEAIRSCFFDFSWHFPEVERHETYESMSSIEQEFARKLIVYNYMQSHEVKSLIDLYKIGLSPAASTRFDEALTGFIHSDRPFTSEMFNRIGFSLEDLIKIMRQLEITDENEKIGYIRSLSFDSSVAESIKALCFYAFSRSNNE